MNLQEELDKYFTEINEEELDEMSTTAAVPGDIKLQLHLVMAHLEVRRKEKNLQLTRQGIQ